MQDRDDKDIEQRISAYISDAMPAIMDSSNPVKSADAFTVLQMNVEYILRHEAPCTYHRNLTMSNEAGRGPRAYAFK
jgi:hypothetical protein